MNAYADIHIENIFSYNKRIHWGIRKSTTTHKTSISRLTNEPVKYGQQLPAFVQFSVVSTSCSDRVSYGCWRATESHWCIS